MKRAVFAVLSLFLLLSLSACGAASAPSEPSRTPAAAPPEPPVSAPAEETGGSSSPEDAGGILTVFFSVPEDLDATGVDAVSGASIVVEEGEILGNVQYMARIIQENAGGDLFRIETVQQYPLKHDALVDFAAEEQDADARPELAALPENLEQYGTVFLGYPNWWADLPMPLYTFLESVDLSGKNIIPFCPHGGSGFSRTLRTIAELQPGASVSEDGLSISRGSVAKSAEEIAAWVRGLGY